MYLYGICLTELKIDYTKVDEFLRTLINTPAHDIIRDYMDEIEDPSDIEDVIDKYESEGYNGLDAMLKDIIRKNEQIDITCDDPDGFHYLGVSADAPWCFNEKTKSLSKEDFIEILTKHIKPFTDDELIFGYHHSEDVCDY